MSQWHQWRLVLRKQWRRLTYRVLALLCMTIILLRSYVAFGLPDSRSALISQIAPKSVPSPQPVQEEPEPQVQVIEVVVQGAEGELHNQVYDTVSIRPGGTITRSQLQGDINAIFATGFFVNVRAIPEDTPLGVRVTFVVQPNPVLQTVRLEGSVLAQPQPDGRLLRFKYEGAQLPLVEAVDRIFGDQYGKIADLNAIQAGISRLNQLYQDNGYVLAQVISEPALDPGGALQLDVAEGVIENIEVRFLNDKEESVDESGEPIQSYTPASTILAQVESRIGEVFNQNQMQAGIQNIYNLAIAEDVSASLNPGADPRKVIVLINLVNNLSEFDRFARTATFFGDTEAAIPYWQAALQIAQHDQPRGKTAIILFNLGNVYAELKQFTLAIEFYQRAELIFEELETSTFARLARAKIAEVYRASGQPEEAINIYDQEISQWHLLNKAPERGNLFIEEMKKLLSNDLDITNLTALNSIFSLLYQIFLVNAGLTYRDLGDYQQALFWVQEAQKKLTEKTENLDVSEETITKGVRQMIAWFSTFFPSVSGSIYSCLGDSSKALAYQEQGWEILNSYVEAIRNDILDSMQNQTVDQESVRFSEDLLKLLRGFSYIAPLCGTSAIVPSTNRQIVQKADSILQFWQFFPDFLQPNAKQSAIRAETNPRLSFDWGKITFLNNLGVLYIKVGEYQKAVDVSQQALQVLQRNEALENENLFLKHSVLDNLSRGYLGLRRQQNALDAAVELHQMNAGFNNHEGVALASDLLGEIYLTFDMVEPALDYFREALELWLTLDKAKEETETRYEIAKLERKRGDLVAAQQQIEAAIKKLEVQPTPSEVTPQTVQDADRLKISPDYIRNKASFALSLSYSTGISPRQGVYRSYPNFATFLSAKRKYYAFYIDLLMQLHQQNPSSEYDIEAFKASEQSRVRSLGAFKDEPGLEPASLQQIQRQILDSDTLLLEYVLGEQDSYLWVVAPDQITSYRLGKNRAQIETVATEFYNLLTEPSGRVRPKTTAAAGKQLSQLILEPIAHQLGDKRLLIVADGILQYIPFSVLPDPVPTQTPDPQALAGEFGQQMQPLLVNHEIINLPAASTLVQLEQNHRNRSIAPKVLAMFADPVFNHADARVQPFLTNPSNSADPRSLSATSLGVEALYPRLPDTVMQEAQSIQTHLLNAQVAPDRVKLYAGFEANHQTAMSGELGQYQIVHFATHGTLSNETPERSGMLLSAISDTGQLQRGLLSTPDAFKLNLPATDLVVLSGCRTGLGSEILGEGLFGLTGGFMNAGVERVVASLWSVQSQPTAELMSRFYQRLVDPNHPDYTPSPAAALRSAQLSMWTDPRWQTPYNWAAFSVQGRWQGMSQVAN